MSIDFKVLRQDPEAALGALAAAGVGAQEIAEIREQTRAWPELRRSVADLRREKQAIALAFKDVLSEEAREALKQRMTTAVAALDSAETRLRELERQLLALLRRTDAPADTQLPERLTLPATEGEAPHPMSFERLSPLNRADWDVFVAGQARASLYHDSRWETLITGIMRQESLCLMARDESGAVVGVLPLYRLRSRLFGDFAVSVPYFNYGGPLGVNAGVESALLRRAGEDAARLGLRHLEVRELHSRSGWPVRSGKVSMIRALPDSVEALDAELGAKLRAQIRRGGREGFNFDFGVDARLLNDFYAVFSRNMRDLGTPVYDRRMFGQILELWPDQAMLLLAYKRRRPVACAFLLQGGDTLEIPWASTLREYNAAAVNMQLYWRVLAFAIERRQRYFDFGRSTDGSGTFRFKKQWGAQPVKHYWHYWLRDGEELPGLNPDNPKYRLLIGCWQRLPVALTRALGPAIVRSLP